MEAKAELVSEWDASAWTTGRKLALFGAISFGTSWAIAGTFQAVNGDWTSPVAAAISVLFTLPPAFAALIVKGPLTREPVAEHLGLAIGEKRWWLAAWLVPAVIVVVCIALATLAPGVKLALTDAEFLDALRDRMPAEQMTLLEAQLRATSIPPALRLLMQGMVSGATFGALIATGEELGWRGFVHHEVSGGLWRKALVTGLVWSAWRAPIVLMAGQYPGGPFVGLVTMIASTMLLSIVFAYVRERSGSVIAAAVMHGTFNAVAHVPLLVTSGGDPAVVGMTGVCGFAAIVVVVACVLLHDRWAATKLYWR